jgi:uncharacterized protein YlxW (UPF0749 family)
LRTSAEFELFQFVSEDAKVLDRVIGEQRAELKEELENLQEEADQKAREIEELTGSVPF